MRPSPSPADCKVSASAQRTAELNRSRLPWARNRLRLRNADPAGRQLLAGSGAGDRRRHRWLDHRCNTAAATPGTGCDHAATMPAAWRVFRWCRSPTASLTANSAGPGATTRWRAITAIGRIRSTASAGRAPGRLSTASATSAVLTLTHAATGAQAARWPFAFEAEQHFTLTADDSARDARQSPTAMRDPRRLGSGCIRISPAHTMPRCSLPRAQVWTNLAEPLPGTAHPRAAGMGPCARASHRQRSAGQLLHRLGRHRAHRLGVRRNRR